MISYEQAFELSLSAFAIRLRDRKRYEEMLEIYDKIIERYTERKNMKFKISQWNNNGYYVICCEKSGCNTHFIWKDGTVHLNSTGYIKANFSFDLAKGYWSTKKEAEIFFAGWLSSQQIDTNRFTKEQEYPLGMRYKDIYGVTWTYYRRIK